MMHLRKGFFRCKLSFLPWDCVAMSLKGVKRTLQGTVATVPCL